MKWKEFGHGLIYITILTSGLLRMGSVPGKKIFSGSPERADRQGENQGNEADSIIYKMANGHNCHQHGKSLPNFQGGRQEDTQRVRPWAPFQTARPHLFVFGSSPLISTALHLC